MSGAGLTLFIDLKPDSRVDLRAAAKAAIAWADMLEDVGAYFDPHHPPSIDLVASEPGSQKIRAAIRSLSSDPKADIRTAVVTSITFIFLVSAAWTWEQVLEWMAGPDAPEEVRTLSEEDRLAIARDVVDALEHKIGGKTAQAVYSQLAADDSVVGAGVTSNPSGKPSLVVKRNEFPHQILSFEEESIERRQRTEETEVVLLRAVLTRETNKRWGFSWPYGRFGAKIKDEGFLDRLASGQLGVPMTEGIVLRVLLEITEEKRENVWTVREYVVLKVLEVRPPAQQEVLDLKQP